MARVLEAETNLIRGQVYNIIILTGSLLVDVAEDLCYAISVSVGLGRLVASLARYHTNDVPVSLAIVGDCCLWFYGGLSLTSWRLRSRCKAVVMRPTDGDSVASERLHAAVVFAPAETRSCGSFYKVHLLLDLLAERAEVAGRYYSLY